MQNGKLFDGKESLLFFRKDWILFFFVYLHFEVPFHSLLCLLNRCKYQPLTCKNILLSEQYLPDCPLVISSPGFRPHWNALCCRVVSCIEETAIIGITNSFRSYNILNRREDWLCRMKMNVLRNLHQIALAPRVVYLYFNCGNNFCNVFSYLSSR